MSPELIRQYTVNGPHAEPLPKHKAAASESASSSSPSSSESSKVSEAKPCLGLLEELPLGVPTPADLEGEPKLVKLSFEEGCLFPLDEDDDVEATRERLAERKSRVDTGFSESVLRSYSRSMASLVRTHRDPPLKPSGCHCTLTIGTEPGPWKNSPTALLRQEMRS